MENKTSKKPVLTISMLISGREEMKKSLESLHYFKDAFPCEVILVDTGCNKEQRAYAEAHADRVIDFVWCDDFSAARNAGLKKAKGEWFMFLDDDEWFDDPQEMVSFFVSGEYREYNSASYVVRNYGDMEGRTYTDSYASRMIKLQPGIQFVGCVHEVLSPFLRPRKAFNDFVHHYGYAYPDMEASRKHSERNIPLLLKMREREPGNARWTMQLAQEYSSIGEHEKAVEACMEGLEDCRKLGAALRSGPSYLGAVYAYLIVSLSNMEKYEASEKCLEKAMADPVMGMEALEPTAAFFCMAGAKLCAQLKKYEKCHEYFRRYMEYKRKFGDDRDFIESGSSGIVSEVFQKKIVYGAVLVCTGSLIRMDDAELAEEAFYLIDWSDKDLLDEGRSEKDMLEACCSVPYRPTWAKIMQTLFSREGGAREMYAVCLLTETQYRKNGEADKLSRLRRLVSELEYGHHYIVYTKILWEAEKAERMAAEASDGFGGAGGKIELLFELLFERHADRLPDIRGEVWDVADRFGIALEPMFLKADYRKWKDALESWIGDASAESLRSLDNRIRSWKRTEDIRYRLFDMKCAEGRLMRYAEKETGLPEWEETLWGFAEITLDFYGHVYKENVFEDMPEVLPGEAQIALHLKKLRECRKARDDKGALYALRGCIGVFPVLEKALEAYAGILKNEIQNRDLEAEKARRELEALVESLKITAKLRMARREYQIAKEILSQIQNCMPEDEEARKLLRQVEDAMLVNTEKK